MGLGDDPECAPYPVLWLGLAVLTALLGSQRLPRAWRGMAKPLPGKDHPSSELAAPTRRGGSGTEGGPAGSSMHGAHCLAAPWPGWPCQPCSPPAGLCLPSWASTWALESQRSGCKCSCAPNWLRDLRLPFLCFSFHF